MRKLTVLMSGITAASFSAAAAAATPEYFVGGQLGYQDNSVEYSETYQGSNVNADLSSSGIAGSVFAGMKFQLNDRFFIAPEVNLGTSNASGELGVDTISAEIDANVSYGLGVLLGADLTSNTSVYGRLGYQKTEYELTISDGTNSASEDDDFGGVRYGLGVATALTPETDLRLDWSQTRYSDETYGTGGGDSFSFEPTESLLQVGISYKF